MALALQGAVELPADQATVWAKLNDPDVLRDCIPGCESLDRTGETSFAALGRAKLGPMTATVRVIVNLTDIEPPNGYRIEAEGDGGLAGFAKGVADVRLAATDGGTLLSYAVEISIGGALARLGGLMVGGMARRVAETFFANFAAAVSA